MSSWNTSQKSKVVGNTAVLVALYLWCEVALASSGQSLSAIVSNLQGNIATIGPLLQLVSYVGGIGFCIGGIVKFKAHKDNPQQTPLSMPLVLLGVGAGLLFLPSVMASAGSTIFGGQGGTMANTAS